MNALLYCRGRKKPEKKDNAKNLSICSSRRTPEKVSSGMTTPYMEGKKAKFPKSISDLVWPLNNLNN